MEKDAANNVEKKHYRFGLVNKIRNVFFWILWYSWYFVNIFEFVMCCDFLFQLNVPLCMEFCFIFLKEGPPDCTSIEPGYVLPYAHPPTQQWSQGNLSFGPFSYLIDMRPEEPHGSVTLSVWSWVCPVTTWASVLYLKMGGNSLTFPTSHMWEWDPQEIAIKPKSP